MHHSHWAAQHKISMLVEKWNACSGMYRELSVMRGIVDAIAFTFVSRAVGFLPATILSSESKGMRCLRQLSCNKLQK